jgi:hypothetical protein
MFSKLDLKKGYYQISVAKEDVSKTAVTTPFGLFEFVRMPFGLRNAGQSFQRLMDSIIADQDAVFAYLDDVLVASAPDQHEQALRCVLQKLRDQGLVLNFEKCEFGRDQVQFLGHTVSAEGVVPLVDHVQAVKQFPQPTTRQELQRFLGLINFYRRFLPAAAQALKPLTDALRGGGGKNKKLAWSGQQDSAFEAAKRLLCCAPCLEHPDPAAAVRLAVDASSTHVGAVLQQQSGPQWQPLAYYSCKLDAAQQKYSAFDRELLAAYLSVRHFRFMLEGRDFVIFSDHKPLSFALQRVSEPWSARQQRHTWQNLRHRFSTCQAWITWSRMRCRSHRRRRATHPPPSSSTQQRR